MFWPVLGGNLRWLWVCIFRGKRLATRNGASYQGAIVEGAFALFAAAVLIGGGTIRRAATEVAASNKRVLIKTGLFSRRSVEVLLPKPESIGVNETFAGRILGYGSVVVRGTGGTFETFDGIRQPNEFRRQVQGQISSN